MDNKVLKILESFRTENFDKLNEDEKMALAEQLVQVIREERGLSELSVEFGDEFAYFDKDNILFLDRSLFTDKKKNNNYHIITGIIHELRHKEQNDKGELNGIYTGKAYDLSPVEFDAHSYATRQLISLSNFFNDNEFDKYVYVLMNNDHLSRQTSLNSFLLDGYSFDEIKELMKLQAKYNEKCLINPKEKAIEHYFIDEKEYTSIFEILKDKADYNKLITIKEYPESNTFSLRHNTLSLTVRGNQAYVIGTFAFNDTLRDAIEALKESAKVFSESLSLIGIEKIEAVHFPVIEIINNKALLEKFYRVIGLNDRSTTLENILALDLSKIEEKEPIDDKINSVDNFNDKYLKTSFGLNYKEKYSEEQQKFLETMIQYMEDYAEYRLFGIANEAILENGAYFAITAYKPEHSLEKLKLIYAAQRSGLNTMHYEQLNEKQIKEYMIAQKEGLSREQLTELLQLDAASMKKRREEILGKNSKYDMITIDDKGNAEFGSSQER